MSPDMNPRIDKTTNENAGRVEKVTKPGSIVDAANYCPNCSTRLKESHCKLKCPQCGFYLSCSDFY